MANYEHLKLQGFDLLKNRMSAKEAAKKLSVPYTEMLKWKRELSQAQLKEDTNTVLEADAAIVHELAEGIQHQLEEYDIEDAEEIVAGVIDKVSKLGQLEVDLQSAGINAVKRIESLIESSRTAADLDIVVGCLVRLQNSFFAKGANVNILNAPQASDPNAPIQRYSDMQRDA